MKFLIITPSRAQQRPPQELVAQLRESLSAISAERSQLRQQLDGRNRLITELFMPREGAADSRDLAELLGVMRTKVSTSRVVSLRHSPRPQVKSIIFTEMEPAGIQTVRTI